MRTILDARTSSGYASRSERGIHGVLDVETALAARFEGRLVTKNFTRQATDYLARDGLVLFDNPDGCLICVFKRENALCDPGPDATAPNQPDCRPGCGNAVRTDQHARDLRDRATRTEQLADRAPAPVARRLRAAAGRDRAASAPPRTASSQASPPPPTAP